MNAPLYSLDQRVKSRLDPALRGRVIAIFTHNTETPPNVHPFEHKGEWQYLVLLDQPALWTQQWFPEDRLEVQTS